MSAPEAYDCAALIDAIVLPGDCLLALASVYIDESGTHDGAPVLCLAGYVFRQRNAREFSRIWGARLQREGIPHFRMSACAHGNWPFGDKERWPVEKRIELEKGLIKLVRARASYGFAVTINEDDYRTLIPPHPDIGSPYSFCLRQCLIAVRSWIESSQFDGRVAYFFEAGHRDQSQANGIMTRVFDVPELRESYKYASHTFADKAAGVALQAADLLAWQWYTDTKRRREGATAPRADCRALLENSNVHVMEWSRETLEQFAAKLKEGLVKVDL